MKVVDEYRKGIKSLSDIGKPLGLNRYQTREYMIKEFGLAVYLRARLENVAETRERVLGIVGTEYAETVFKNITQNDCLSALHEGFGLPKNMTKLGLEFVQKHGVKKLTF